MTQARRPDLLFNPQTSMPAAKIAILEDDPAQAEWISSVLSAETFHVDLFMRGAALKAAMRRTTYDLLILDWNVPDHSGLEVLEWARLKPADCPPIMLATSRADDTDVVRALDAGADDFIVKPFSASVLVARTKALLRRANPVPSSTIVERLEGIQFDALTSSAVVRGVAVVLTGKEFSLAVLFLRNPHRALSRSYLVQAVWANDPDVNSRSLDVHVSRIRTKLGLRPEYGFRLAPVPSYGYRLETLDSPSRHEESID